MKVLGKEPIQIWINLMLKSTAVGYRHWDAE
jgi:hypothetical protein